MRIVYAINTRLTWSYRIAFSSCSVGTINLLSALGSCSTLTTRPAAVSKKCVRGLRPCTLDMIPVTAAGKTDLRPVYTCNDDCIFCRTKHIHTRPLLFRLDELPRYVFVVCQFATLFCHRKNEKRLQARTGGNYAAHDIHLFYISTATLSPPLFAMMLANVGSDVLSQLERWVNDRHAVRLCFLRQLFLIHQQPDRTQTCIQYCM